MSGQLKISVDAVQTVNVPFQCRIHIAGGLAGDDVEIRLQQSDGMPPAYEGCCCTTLDGNGNGLVVFEDVKLIGPCVTRLVARDARSSAQLYLDDVQIEVVR
jgi:hypothetical protein